MYVILYIYVESVRVYVGVLIVIAGIDLEKGEVREFAVLFARVFGSDKVVGILIWLFCLEDLEAIDSGSKLKSSPLGCLSLINLLFKCQISLMDVSVQYPDPVKEDLFSPDDWGQLWSNCNRGGCTVDDLVAKLGSALEDALLLLSTSTPPLGGYEVCFLEKNKDCGELINPGESLVVTSNSKLGENTSLPCSGNMHFCNVLVSGKDKISNTALDGQSSLESGNPTSTSIMSLPTSLKLVSAMKGSREKQGLHVGKLSVSWAPDVYDPPPTSQSHTVTNQMNKKSYRHKHKHKHKAKSPRSSSIDKKHHRKISRSSSKVASY